MSFSKRWKTKSSTAGQRAARSIWGKAKLHDRKREDEVRHVGGGRASKAEREGGSILRGKRRVLSAVRRRDTSEKSHRESLKRGQRKEKGKSDRERKVHEFAVSLEVSVETRGKKEHGTRECHIRERGVEKEGKRRYVPVGDCGGDFHDASAGTTRLRKD